MYDFKEIEKKWQDYWDTNEVFVTDVMSKKEPYYVLDMFPYPSGAGLHVGHLEGYTATDIIARYKRMQGFEVMHPMGWDAFGLPAEQFAVKTGNHPGEFTTQNINNFRRQMKSIGFSYDWTKEIATTDEKYYKWTQWIFTQLYKMDLAELKDIPVNFCPICKTVLANEEVIDGRCERGNHVVEKKILKQWSLKISEYSQRLLDDLEEVDWPENLKEMQRNWIGRSQGAEIKFSLKDQQEEIKVFTTRPDTIYGVTYVVLAYDHPLTSSIITPEQKNKVTDFIEQFKNKSDLERTDLNKDKSGIFTGSYAIHPLTGEELPIWLGDYVLATYGTGAVMAVPAHDQRDYEFAKKYQLPIKQVIEGDISKQAYTDDGIHINSETLNGLNKKEAIEKSVQLIEENNAGTEKINYHLRDWIFSRQRYWGEPFPIVHLEDGTIKILERDELPVRLPHVQSFEPDDEGNSALAKAKEFYDYVDPKTGQRGRRELNTMPQWAGSSWYYLRYLDPNNDEELVRTEVADKWLPVDLYVGGAEHAVLHLLYARFWHKVLYDIGIVHTKEPFQRVVNQGMILGENHEKMSKSKGNVVNPDDLTSKYGADTIRMYEMFMGPLEASKPWSEEKIHGTYKFLEKIKRAFENLVLAEPSQEMEVLHHQTIKKVTSDFDRLAFNTAISQMMIYVNKLTDEKKLTEEQAQQFIQLLSPVIPHLAEELWLEFGNGEELSFVKWPVYDESKLEADEIEIIIQVNGKVKKKTLINKNLDKDEQLNLAKNEIKDLLEGKEIIKEISVPQKLVNIVIK